MTITSLSFVGFCEDVLGVTLEPGQRVFWSIAADGVQPGDLTGADREVAAEMFGDVDEIPDGARRHIAIIKGADVGFSFIAGLRLLHRALTATELGARYIFTALSEASETFTDGIWACRASAVTSPARRIRHWFDDNPSAPVVELYVRPDARLDTRVRQALPTGQRRMSRLGRDEAERGPGLPGADDSLHHRARPALSSVGKQFRRDPERERGALHAIARHPEFI